MDTKIFNALAKVDVCSEDLIYIAQYDTPQEAWDACEDPAFLLWVLGRFGCESSLGGLVLLARKWAADVAFDAPYTDASDVDYIKETLDEIKDYAGEGDIKSLAEAAECCAATAYFVGPETTYGDQCQDIRRLFPTPPKIA